MDAIPANTKDSTIAGPAFCAATVPREYENAGANDRANAEGSEIDRAESAFKAVIGQRLSLQIGNAFPSK